MTLAAVAIRRTLGKASTANAAHALAFPTADGSGATVEQGVIDFGSGNAWNGHRFWAVTVAYGGNSAINENPSVWRSDDGITWSAPVGLTNPVVAYPGGGANGNNSDPCIFYNPNDSNLYLVYEVENASTMANNGVWARSSTDGVSWSTATQLLSWTVNHQMGMAELIWDSVHSLYTIMVLQSDTGSAPYRPVKYTASSVLGPYSGRTNYTLSIPRGATYWPFHWGAWTKIGSRWYCVFSDQGDGSFASQWLWVVSTADFASFKVSGDPILKPSSGAAWDSTSMYTGTLIPTDDGSGVWLYYTATNGTNYSIGRTRVSAAFLS